jgi:hypothetical protein
LNFIKKYKVYSDYLNSTEARHPNFDHNSEMIKNMSQFIKRNKKLQHLNLDSTFMSEHMLFRICSSLTRSPSCLSLHCSGNPGITHRLKQMLWRRIRAKDPNFQVNKLDIERDWRRDMQSEVMRDKLLRETMNKRQAA